MSDSSEHELRLGVVIHRLQGGGAEHVTRLWTTQLRDAGVDLVVYLKDPLVADAPPPDGIVFRANPRWASVARGALYPLWLRRHLRRDRRTTVLTVLQYSSVVGALAVALWRERPALVVSERNLPSFRRQASSRSARWRQRLLAVATRWAYRRADALIAPSHPVGAAAAVGYGLPPERISVVPNPVAPPDRRPPRRSRTTGTPPHVVFVGRLSPDKRLGLFLDVVRELVARIPGAHATIIGDGSLRAELEQRVAAESLPVAFAGWRTRWWEASEEFDCLLMTSASEGFGNVLVEAASAGLPVVASSRALSVADAVVPGVTGELTATDTASAFADAVERVNQRDPTTPDMVARWLERFSPARSTKQLLEVLEAAQRGSRRST